LEQLNLPALAEQPVSLDKKMFEVLINKCKLYFATYSGKKYTLFDCSNQELNILHTPDHILKIPVFIINR